MKKDKIDAQKKKNISSEDQYRVFCMFSQLSKEETDGYDCDEMWDYCHVLYDHFCNSEYNDLNMSEIMAMREFLENIDERIAWCKDNPPPTNGQNRYRVYSSITTKYFVEINAIDKNNAMDKARNLPDYKFTEIEECNVGDTDMVIEQARLLEDKDEKTLIRNEIKHIDNWTDMDDLHEKYRFYTEADLNNCWLTRDDWIKEIAWAWTNPKSSLESFKEEYLGYCMERLCSYDEEVSEHIMMRHEELEKKKEVSHV
jgi:hypothetical protein